MDLTSLNNRSAEWLTGGPEDDVVLSSRVRLVRNIDGYPYISHCTARQMARIEELIHHVLSSLEADWPLNYVRLDELSALYRELLLERHLISQHLAEADWVSAVAFADGEQSCVIVNEEDHLRLHCTQGGLRLHDALRAADDLDDLLAERIPFAFSPRYGYLSASPLNVGTGMRASVMLHLPGLGMAHEMDRLIEIAQGADLVLRGVYGEGMHGAGDFYQMFNRVTLGMAEDEIAGRVEDAAKQVVELERSCRLSLYSSHPEQFMGRMQRAYELLCSAATLSSQETLSFLSQVRLGVEMDLLNGPELSTVHELLLLTLPAHLQTMEGGELDSTVRNARRADYVRSRFATG